MRCGEHGQSTLEYAALIAAAALALGAMGIYLERSAKANFTNLEDELNGAAEETPGVPTPPPGPL